MHVKFDKSENMNENKKDYQLEELLNRKHNDRSTEGKNVIHLGELEPSGLAQELLYKYPKEDEGDSNIDREEVITRSVNPYIHCAISSSHLTQESKLDLSPEIWSLNPRTSMRHCRMHIE